MTAQRQNVHLSAQNGQLRGQNNKRLTHRSGRLLGSWADDHHLVEVRPGGPQGDGDGFVGAPLAGARGRGQAPPLQMGWPPGRTWSGEAADSGDPLADPMLPDPHTTIRSVG